MIEATTTASDVKRLGEEPLVHTNHCLSPAAQAVEAERPEGLVVSSVTRLAQAKEMLDAEITFEGLVSLLSDERSICRYPEPPFDYETSGAVVMRPATGELWACQGRPSENEFERFEVGVR